MFESDDDDDESEEDDANLSFSVQRRGRRLTSLPEQARITTPRARPVVPDRRRGGRNEEDEDDARRRRFISRQRRFFTEEEKQAIREGVRRFGKGHWATIKAEYAIILRNRTSVQIKVRKSDNEFCR